MPISFACHSHRQILSPSPLQEAPRVISSGRQRRPSPVCKKYSQQAQLKCEAASQDSDAGSPEPPSNSLFSAQFSAALKGALEREGSDALTSGETKPYEEPKPSAAEEVLSAALQEARRNLSQMDNIVRALTKQQEREQKQYERLQFAFKRAQGDAAYIRSCEKRLESNSKS